MLPKNVNNFIDKLLLATFNKIPILLRNRVLWVLHRNPTLMDSWGYHLRPFHYYEPIPEFSAISQEQALKRRFSTAIDWQLEAQLDFVEKLSAYNGEIQQLAEEQDSTLKFNFFNDFYFELDAAVYYALLREIKPSTIIEIGCGYSTQIAAQAIAINQQEGKASKIICIEPYPEPQLTDANLKIQLINERVETIDLKGF
jgi:hypothetical protein